MTVPAGANALRVVPPERVRLTDLPFRYPTRSPGTLQIELDQIAGCVRRGVPRLMLQPLRDDVLSVVGFGPTLQATWREIRAPMMTTSGAHDFLMERGIVPDYHAQMDGRDHQAKFLRWPQPETVYLMASICAPAVWDALRGYQVRYWHNAHGQHVVDWIGVQDPGAILIAAASHIGLTAVHVGGILGFRRFRLYGIDGHWQDGARHAGEHHDPNPQRQVTREADGRAWISSPQMSNGAEELLWTLDQAAGSIEVAVVGDSLQAALVREWERSSAWWVRTLGAVPRGWLADAAYQVRAQDALRVGADYNTGSIVPRAVYALRALAHRTRPAVVVEVGTFIGNSTLALAGDGRTVYTCDRSNDVFPARPGIVTFPRQDAATLFRACIDQGLGADLVFLDGRLRPEDVPWLMRVLRPDGAVVVDDYRGREKGVCNLDLIRPLCPGWTFLPPCATLGAGVPLAILASPAWLARQPEEDTA